MSMLPADAHRRLVATPHEIANAIHWPEHWDTAAYPTLESALSEMLAWFVCSQCSPMTGLISDAAACATPPVPWNEAARICNTPAVDEAIRALIGDPHDDNAICMVRAVLEEQRNG